MKRPQLGILGVAEGARPVTFRDRRGREGGRIDLHAAIGVAAFAVSHELAWRGYGRHSLNIRPNAAESHVAARHKLVELLYITGQAFPMPVIKPLIFRARSLMAPDMHVLHASHLPREDRVMQLAAARIVAVILMANGFASVAEAAVIRGSATFEVEWLGDEEQGRFNPPLLGSGSFEIRSRPYDPDNVSEVFDFEVLDFSFSFAGASWDESDLRGGDCCIFAPDGQPDTITFNFDNGDAQGGLIWSFEGFVGGAFGMDFVIGSLAGSGNSENGQAGSEIDSSFVVVPEPGSLALLGLGLLGLGLTRRRAKLTVTLDAATSPVMQPLAVRLIAVVLVSGVLASVAEAAIIRGSGTFEVLIFGDEDFGDVFDPPLVGSGSFEIRSRPYDPDDVSDVFDFDVLDFSFSLAGFTWDESDITSACCQFTPDGQPITVDFEFDNGDARGLLVWGFEDGVFGMDIFAPNLQSRGDSDTGTADGGEIDFNFVKTVPEPGTLALLGLGLLGLGLTRRSL